MSEWFYLQQWRASSKEVWVILDENLNLCMPENTFYNKYQALHICEILEVKNKKKYKVVNNESTDYFCAVKNREDSGVSKRNEQSG